MTKELIHSDNSKQVLEKKKHYLIPKSPQSSTQNQNEIDHMNGDTFGKKKRNSGAFNSSEEDEYLGLIGFDPTKNQFECIETSLRNTPHINELEL